MKNKILIIITVFAMFTATFYMSFSSVSAQGYAGTIKSKYIQGDITLDGRKDLEWGTVEENNYTLYEFESPTLERELIMSSVYNDTTLFFWISVDEVESGAAIYLIFQTNETSPIITDRTIPTFADGNDVKFIHYLNVSADEFISSNLVVTDESNGGTNDIDGKCWARSGGYDFEIAMTLNSSDTNGGDVSLMQGDSVNLFPFYTSNGEFMLIQSADGVWEQIRVELSKPFIPSYSIPIIIVSVLAVSFILIYKHKEKF